MMLNVVYEFLRRLQFKTYMVLVRFRCGLRCIYSKQVSVAICVLLNPVFYMAHTVSIMHAYQNSAHLSGQCYGENVSTVIKGM